MSISIDVDAKLYLDGKEVDEDKLRGLIKQAYKGDPEVKAVISADSRVQHGAVVAVIDLLRQEHITKFAINTSPVEDSTKSD